MLPLHEQNLARHSLCEFIPFFARFCHRRLKNLKALPSLLLSVCQFSKAILPATPPGLSDWHIESSASPRNQKIGSPRGLPQFSDCAGVATPRLWRLPVVCHQAAIGAAWKQKGDFT
jgi:hypothetical protein